MSMFYYVEPEVAGGFGDGTVMDTAVTPPHVRILEYEFSGWMGDELLESFPCFVVTLNLARALKKNQFTGFTLATVGIKKTDQFDMMYPSMILPEFKWLKVHAVAGSSDFGLSQDFRLVVSDAALEVIKSCGLKYADIEVYS